MASVSGTTSSLGNTTLRGFGGMVSGIDRDSIIEQMSLASQTKIQNQKNAITSLTWKQEAYRGVIDQIVDLQDKYLSYSATSNLTDISLFSKNVITAKGDEKVTKYITASGSSDFLDMMSVRGVEQLATAASVQSGAFDTKAIDTGKKYEGEFKTSNLVGTNLNFGYYGTEDKFYSEGTFTFASSYRDSNGKTVQIDYTAGGKELADQLNASIEANKFKLSSDKTIQFEYDETNDAMKINYVKVKTVGQSFEIDKKNPFTDGNGTVIRAASSALSALGLNTTEAKEEGGNKGYTLETFNANVGVKGGDDTYAFSNKSVTKYTDMASYLKGKKFTITYGGQSKSVELIKQSDLDEINAAADADKEAMFVQKMQANLDKAFGSGKVVVESKDGKIQFDDNTHNGTTLTISSSDDAVMKQIGLDKLNSTKVSMESSLWDNRDRLGLSGLAVGGTEKEQKEAFNEALKNFSINGVQISGLDADTTVSQMIKKINSSDAGVKATYLSNSNKLSLISTETGSGRTIDIGGRKGSNGEWLGSDDNVASILFGGGTSRDGQDAVMYVDFGNGEAERIVSSTNTFDLDGLKVTASGVFGGVTKDGATGKVTFDNTQSVTFDASANIEKATETVKKFIEDYNALIKTINDHITTKPDSSYGPLSDAQKDEMSETSIENWEKKAKEGLLYNDSVMRDLSMDMSGVLNQLLGSVSYDDLEEMGITMSQDLYDGGTLTFDEEKFKAAMGSDPEKVGSVFVGGNGVSKGLTSIVGDTLKQYATRYSYQNNGSYGRLVEVAGSEKMTLSLKNNEIYNQLKEMQEALTTLQTRLKTEQDRYIKQFTSMETAISNMNTQSSYLSSISG